MSTMSRFMIRTVKRHRLVQHNLRATKVGTRTTDARMQPLLFPPLCLGCGVLLGPSIGAIVPLCRMCRAEHVPLPADKLIVDGIAACFAFEGPLAASLVRLKFEGQLAVAGPLGALLARNPCFRRSPASGSDWDVAVSVPLHPWRQLVRGYNQSLVLARWARRAAALPVARLRPDLLRRVRATRPQSELPAAARSDNVRAAFLAAKPAAVAGRRVLVIDDVTTTGSTLRACRDALYSAGASEVGALALLRALA